MTIDQLEELQANRSQLWAAACAKQITVEQLYAALAKLRALAGDDLYPARRIGRR